MADLKRHIIKVIIPSEPTQLVKPNACNTTMTKATTKEKMKNQRSYQDSLWVLTTPKNPACQTAMKGSTLTPAGEASIASKVYAKPSKMTTMTKANGPMLFNV